MKFELIIIVVFGLVVIIASLENWRRYWIKFIPHRYTNFSSMTGNKKPLLKTSFWNFVERSGTKYPESPFVFNRSIIITSLGNLWGYWIKFIPLRCINFSSMTGRKKLLNPGEAGNLAPIGAVSFSNPGGLGKI